MAMMVFGGFMLFLGIARWWLCLSCWWCLVLALILSVMGEIQVVTEGNEKPVKRDWNAPKKEGKYERQLKRIIKEFNTEKA